MFPPPQIENWHSAFAKNVLNCVQISPCASCFEFGQKKSGECDLNPINCPNTGGNLWEPITKQFLTGLPVKHLRPRSTSVLFSLKILSSECQIFVKKKSSYMAKGNINFVRQYLSFYFLNRIMKTFIEIKSEMAMTRNPQKRHWWEIRAVWFCWQLFVWSAKCNQKQELWPKNIKRTSLETSSERFRRNLEATLLVVHCCTPSLLIGWSIQRSSSWATNYTSYKLCPMTDQQCWY